MEDSQKLRAFFALLTSYAEAKQLRIPVDVCWFWAIDDDQTGKELLEELEEMTDKALQEMIDAMDIDGNGEINPSAVHHPVRADPPAPAVLPNFVPPKKGHGRFGVPNWVPSAQLGTVC